MGRYKKPNRLGMAGEIRSFAFYEEGSSRPVARELANSESLSFDQRRRGGISGVRLKELRSRHVEICRRAALGESNLAIAAALKMTPAQVSNVINSPLAQGQIAAMRKLLTQNTFDEFEEKLRQHVPEAIETVATLMSESENDSVKLKAATEIIDRGFKPVERLVKKEETRVLAKYVLELKERARGAGVLSAMEAAADAMLVEPPEAIREAEPPVPKELAL